MALNKISRVHSLPPGAAEKLLPPEVVKMARGMNGSSGNKKANKVGASDADSRLKPRMAKMFHDQDPSLVHKKSPWDYIPPSER